MNANIKEAIKEKMGNMAGGLLGDKKEEMNDMDSSKESKALELLKKAVALLEEAEQGE